MIDEVILQRLVDGELDDAQTRQLLNQAQQSPPSHEAWKKLAVAYAENQMLQRGFQSFDDAMTVPAETQKSNTPRRSNSGRSSLILTARPVISAGDVDYRSIGWPMAAAACLVIAMVVGYQQMVLRTDTTAADATAANTPGNLPPTIERGLAELPSDDPKTNVAAGDLHDFNRQSLLALKPDHHLQPDQLPRGIGQSSLQQIPLYNVRRFAPQQLTGLQNSDASKWHAWFDNVMPGSGFDDQTKSDYRNAGLLVDQDIEILSGRLEDGRTYMVPYRSVRLSAGQ